MITEYKAKARRKVRGTSVDEGQTLFAIQKGNLFFVWSYSDLAFAQAMDYKLAGPEDKADREANWRESVESCVPSDRKSF